MSFDFSTLITDRTQADVSRAQELASKIRSGTASESELAEFNSAAMKGAYNHTDLNRVTAAMESLKAKLESYGYSVPGYQRIKVPHVLPEPEPTSRLPEGYTELAWIESTGTQYIDSLYKPTSEKLRIVADFTWADVSSGKSVIAMQDGTRTDGKWLVWYMESNGNLRHYIGNTNGLNMAVTAGTNYLFDITADNGTLTAVRNGNTQTMAYSGTIPKSYSIAIFGNHANGTFLQLSSVKLRSTQIYDNGTLVRDYIPCINPSGDVGLYDLVTAAFFGNSGTGAFVAGAIPRELPEGYTQVEYIQSNGSQYIDTLVAHSASSNIVLTADVSYDTVSPSNQIMGFSGSGGNGIGTSKATWWETSEFGSVTVGQKYSVEYAVNGATWNRTVDGATVSGSRREYKFTTNLFLLAANMSATNATMSYFCSCKVYDAKVFVDESVVRDFVPCKNSSGVVGLYDMVNGVFYQNAGSGAFSAGYEVASPVTAAVDVVSNDLTEYDPYTWYEFDWPTTETMTIYLQNVVALRSVFAVVKSTPSVPKDAVGLMVQEANNIEKILVDINELFIKSTQVWFYSGELFAGEV